MILIFGLLLVAFAIWSGVYTVPSDSAAVVQRQRGRKLVEQEIFAAASHKGLE